MEILSGGRFEINQNPAVMFSLSARFRKSRTPGAHGSVFYSIREGKTDRCITGSLTGADENIISEAKEQIAFDLMTIYCVIENLQKRNLDISLEQIVATATEAISGHNPYKKRIDSYNGRYPVCDDVAKISKLFSDFFEREKKLATSFDISTLQGFISSLIQEYTLEGKAYSKSLRSTQRSLNGYINGKDIPLQEMTGQFISGYKEYLDDKVTPETASFYLRNLRTALIRAEHEHLLPIHFTWPENIKTNIPLSIRKTKNNGLDLNTIRQIEKLDLSSEKNLDFARDMFMFGFYTQGMELIDIAMLKKENLSAHTLVYKRRQKGKERKINLGDKALAIIEKYNNGDSEYLFPIIQRKWRYSYSTARNEFADSLSKIGIKLQLPVKLTFSMNIYSWESVIRNVNIAEALVS